MNRVKVLFVHGLEANDQGIKVQHLKRCDQFDVHCPLMPCTKNIWQSFAIIVRETRVFCPDIIVASSYGTIIVLLMIQMGVWHGKTVLLATAMAEAAPSRLVIPHTMQSLTVVVHGTADRICPIQPIRQWTFNNHIEFIELQDTHKLKSLTTETSLLVHLVETISTDNSKPSINQSISLKWMLLKLTGIVIVSIVSFGFRKIKSFLC